MKLLLVAATPFELQPLMERLKLKPGHNKLDSAGVDILITGVGMVATAFALGKQLVSAHYTLAINAGIAGSFDAALELGEVVTVSEDYFAELGAEDGEDFITIDELGFGTQQVKPLETDLLIDNSVNLKTVRAISVNKVHGNETAIAKTKARFNPQIESMEGAAFFYACNQNAIPFIQLRAISNYVERRNRDSWKIPLAVSNLNNELTNLINNLI